MTYIWEFISGFAADWLRNIFLSGLLIFACIAVLKYFCIWWIIAYCTWWVSDLCYWSKGKLAISSDQNAWRLLYFLFFSSTWADVPIGVTYNLSCHKARVDMTFVKGSFIHANLQRIVFRRCLFLPMYWVWLCPGRNDICKGIIHWCTNLQLIVSLCC